MNLSLRQCQAFDILAARGLMERAHPGQLDRSDGSQRRKAISLTNSRKQLSHVDRAVLFLAARQ